MKKILILFSLVLPIQCFGVGVYVDALPERHADLPVSEGEWPFTDPEFPYDRCVRHIEMPRPGLGEIWDISAELHVSNEDLRDRGKGLALTSEILIGPTSGNSRFTNGVLQLVVLRANGTFNIGVEAHHGLISRRAIVEWTQDKLDYIQSYQTIFVKLMAWASSTAAIAGDRCEITPGRGYLKVLVFPPTP